MKTDDYKQELRVSATLHPTKAKKNLYTSQSRLTATITIVNFSFTFVFVCRAQNILSHTNHTRHWLPILFSPERKKRLPHKAESLLIFLQTAFAGKN
jgi:hypothetical protein